MGEMEEKAGNKKIWRVGTLTYTMGGLVALFCWLLWGDFAWAMKDRAIGPAATLLIRTFDVNDFLFSLIIISFPSFTNIFLMPIISYISDRHRGRWGRRIPFLFFTTPFIVVGACGLGFSPMLGKLLFNLTGEAISLNTACLICFGVFWALLDFGTTLSSALSGALVNDVVPKEMLGRFYGLFRAISLLAGMLFNFYLLKLVEAHYFYIFIGVGLFYGIGLYSLCWKVREGEYPPVDTPPVKKIGDIYKPFLTYFRQCFSMPYYRWVIAAMVLSGMAASPYNMYAILYAKSPVINMDMALYGKVLTICYGISFCLSFFLGTLADRFHPLRMSIAALLTYLATMIAGWFWVKDEFSFEVIMYLHTVLSGCYFTLSASLGQRLFPHLLFAQFNSAYSMIHAITTVLVSMLFGWLLLKLNSDYRYCFLFGTVMTGLGIACLVKIYFDFLKLGGDKAYQAPDPGE